MSRFQDIRLGFSRLKPNAHSTRISAKPQEKRVPVAPGTDTLQRALEDMYWEGVRDELSNIIRTLALWQQPELCEVSVPDENEDLIHGFDTFVDHVSQHAREYANKYNKARLENMDQAQQAIDRPQPSYVNVITEAAKDRKFEFISSKIKSNVRQTMDDMPSLSGMEKRAWMLLQAAGFLDIEKMIEDQPASKKEKRPVIPQLGFSQDRPLDFYPLRCANTQCNAIITGSMFKSNDTKKPRVVCEDCYFRFHCGEKSYSKLYKHCILLEAITPEVSRKICHCSSVPHSKDDELLALFPVPGNARHDEYAMGDNRCELCTLNDLVAVAKYKGLCKAAGIKTAKREARPKSTVEVMSLLQHYQPRPERSISRTLGKFVKSSSTKITSDKPEHILHASAALGETITDPQADPDIPAFFEAHVDRDPFANVRARLRVGPLIIENGVSPAEDGALITLRETPIFHERRGISTTEKRCLIVTSSKDRKLWQHVQPVRNRTNYKVIMKQVVGAPFTGLLPQDPERVIVREILLASQSEKETDPGAVLDTLLESLKNLMGSRVEKYLSSLAERLLSPSTCLAWSAMQNNCHHFCNSLIDHDVFGHLICDSVEPLYLMSFVCPDEGYLRPAVLSKFSVPTGLTQDYISQLYFGYSENGADIIDTYQEYWYDWANFGGPLYKYQNVFPWDCTEAYGRYPTCCGECNLSKHVWAFPYDSWSMISHHLTRDQHMYAPSSLCEPLNPTAPTPQAWMRNRLYVLSASAILCRAAAAMAKTTVFRSATAWLSPSSKPGSELRSMDPSLARVKLGGIHRAQPYSRLLFDKNKRDNSNPFMAEWGTRPLSEQIGAYKEARRLRINLADVELAPQQAEDGVGFSSSQWVGNSAVTSKDSTTKFEFHMDVALTPVDTVYGNAAGCAVACGSSCASGCGNTSCGGVANPISYPSAGTGSTSGGDYNPITSTSCGSSSASGGGSSCGGGSSSSCGSSCGSSSSGSGCSSSC